MITTILILFAMGMVALILEVFLPGGILGGIGGIALTTAIIYLFIGDASFSFPLAARAGCALGILVLGAALFIFAMRNFDRTTAGSRLSLDTTIGNPIDPDTADLIGATGPALTSLEPGGKAHLGGQSIRVVSESGVVDEGAPVRVTRVEAGTIFVRRSV